MSEHIHQRWPEPEEMAEILADLKYGTPILFELAQDVFADTVDPEAYHKKPTEDEMVQCNMAFSEWSLFDFNLGEEMTPLKRAVRKDPSLAEFADTQFYSVFWVITQDRENSVSRLRDIVTCEDFLVHDQMVARNRRWAKGMLGVRIARVDGEWRLAGQVHLHDNAESEPLPHDDAMDGLGIQNPFAFIGHVQSVLGHTGVYRGTLLDNGFIEMEDAS
ncbi:MAG: hypothetical protein Q4D48_06180 [Coriobacteriales bacterium]|jgi:hypothetical protein|nr:hypothetical protein [Coriobacteriales bacterium]